MALQMDFDVTRQIPSLTVAFEGSQLNPSNFLHVMLMLRAEQTPVNCVASLSASLSTT